MLQWLCFVTNDYNRLKDVLWFPFLVSFPCSDYWTGLLSSGAGHSTSTTSSVHGQIRVPVDGRLFLALVSLAFLGISAFMVYDFMLIRQLSFFWRLT